MDGNRFDLYLKSLLAASSRRRTLGGLLGGVLASVIRPDDGLTAKGACKKKCGKCERCRKRKCRPKPNGTRCGTNKFCQGGICRLRCGSGVPCFVFVTSTTHNGNLGGVAAADKICQRLADRARLPGLYKAWLSESPGSTPNTRFRTSNGPYVLVNGTPIASSYADLTSGNVDNQIRVMENRSFDPGSFVWTNTFPNGAAGGSFAFASCGSWTSEEAGDIGNVGASNQTAAPWTASTTANCDQALRLYCVQQA